MSDPETPAQPLLGGRNNVPAEGGRSSRSYKVAGFTLLACVLIAGQAIIAYFLLSQRSDIKSLEEQNHNLHAELTEGRSGAKPIRMGMPINSFQTLMDVSSDEEASTRVQEKPDPQQATNCQLEAAGVKPMPVAGFKPACDERGLYQAQQCYMRHCWCVNPANGKEVPGTLRVGQASCSKAVFTGSMIKALDLPGLTA